MPSGVSYICANAVLKDKKERVNISFIIKKLCSSPTFVANLIMIILKVLGVTLPAFALSFVSKVSDANAFLCMFMIGLMFELKFQPENLKRVGKIIAARLVVSFSAAAAVMCLLPFDFELRKALAVVVFSPIAALPLAFTDKMGGDVELASFVNSISILLSMILMTALMIFI